MSYSFVLSGVNRSSDKAGKCVLRKDVAQEVVASEVIGSNIDFVQRFRERHEYRVRRIYIISFIT